MMKKSSFLVFILTLSLSVSCVLPHEKDAAYREGFGSGYENGIKKTSAQLKKQYSEMEQAFKNQLEKERLDFENTYSANEALYKQKVQESYETGFRQGEAEKTVEIDSAITITENKASGKSKKKSRKENR